MSDAEKLHEGIIQNDDGTRVILLPQVPIRSEVIGDSGVVYVNILHYDPDLGRPTAKLTVKVSGGQS